MKDIEGSEWREIGSAPEGVWVLVGAHAEVPTAAIKERGGWGDGRGVMLKWPTHWMPLPGEVPVEESREEELEREVEQLKADLKESEASVQRLGDQVTELQKKVGASDRPGARLYDWIFGLTDNEQKDLRNRRIPELVKYLECQGRISAATSRIMVQWLQGYVDIWEV